MASNLDTLPSELRKLIVSHLAPHPDSLRPGCKSHLKSANLAHACLREWVPEYMFRDMALNHVLVGISSHLALFAFTPENDRLLQHVKHIVVQVPPAIRWEVGLDDPGRLTVEGHTTERLYKKFQVRDASQLCFNSRRYCHDYYQAMVKPFTHGNWYRLLRAAQSSWSQVFKQFPRLEEISVGVCSIVGHPSPTLTYVFVLRNGKSVMEELDPPFIQDDAANTGWASSIVLKTAPSSVRSLRLGLANLDNFNPSSTVNRVLGSGYRWPHIHPALELGITRLSLTLCGIAGTHGSQAAESDLRNGYTGSIGPAAHLRAVLRKTQGLQHLEFRDHLSNDDALRFSDASMTNAKGCLLDWILPYVRLDNLRTLRLSGFLLDEATVQEKTLAGPWPSLEILILDRIQLFMIDEDDEDAPHSSSRKRQHLYGQSWLGLCRSLVKKTPGLKIEIGSPLSRVSDQSPQSLDPLYVETIQLSPRVTLSDLIDED